MFDVASFAHTASSIGLPNQGASATGQSEEDPKTVRSHQMLQDHQMSRREGHQKPSEWPPDAQTHISLAHVVDLSSKTNSASN